MTDTVAVLMPGDMGHATGRVLAGHGVEPITCLAGRSERTKALAQAAGFRDVETLDAVVVRGLGSVLAASRSLPVQQPLTYSVLAVLC